MWIVVTARPTTSGVSLDAYGPWTWEVCDRERRRLLAEHALQDDRFDAQVLNVRPETVP